MVIMHSIREGNVIIARVKRMNKCSYSLSNQTKIDFKLQVLIPKNIKDIDSLVTNYKLVILFLDASMNILIVLLTTQLYLSESLFPFIMFVLRVRSISVYNIGR